MIKTMVSLFIITELINNKNLIKMTSGSEEIMPVIDEHQTTCDGEKEYFENL